MLSFSRDVVHGMARGVGSGVEATRFVSCVELHLAAKKHKKRRLPNSVKGDIASVLLRSCAMHSNGLCGDSSFYVWPHVSI